MLPKKKATGDEYSILQTSTEARLLPGVEYKQLSMCTLSVQNCSARPKPGTLPTLQGCNFDSICQFSFHAFCLLCSYFDFASFLCNHSAFFNSMFFQFFCHHFFFLYCCFISPNFLSLITSLSLTTLTPPLNPLHILQIVITIIVISIIIIFIIIIICFFWFFLNF